MSLEIRLYGKFSNLATETDAASNRIGIIKIEENSFERISDVLDYLGLHEEEVSHLFLNGEYSSPSRKIPEESRLAIFPKNMGLLYKWYFTPKD